MLYNLCIFSMECKFILDLLFQNLAENNITLTSPY